MVGCRPGVGVVTGLAVGATSGRLGPVFALAGIAVGGAGLAASVLTSQLDPGAVAELGVLAGFALIVGLLLSLVAPNARGAIVVINPAVSFTFAILLLFGLGPALAAHFTALSALTLRHKVPPLRTMLLTVQFVAAVSTAYGVIMLGGGPTDGGLSWTTVHDAVVVIGAGLAWLLVYLGASHVFNGLNLPLAVQVPPPTGTGLLFNGALIALAPAVAVTAETELALAALVLVPLYAVQRMARLSVERLRSARMDPLTSIANRATLRDTFTRLAQVSDQRPASPQPALLMLSLDRFKYVNDALGFEMGDQVLVAVAARLAQIHDGSEIVARLGTDEFAVLALAPDQHAEDELVGRTVDAFQEPVRVGGLSIDVSTSMGLARRAAKENFGDVLRHADTAMYDAKRRGGGVGRYRARGDDSVERLRLLADFRQALTLESDDIAMYYQPQVNLATGNVDGLEALLRWTHPVQGPIDAMSIIAMAEHTAVMRLLTSRVITLVTAQLARWRDDGIAVRVAVNISARDLYDENIVAQLNERLEHHGLPAHLFQVEITESALLTDPVAARTTLHRIADLGIDVSLDDFGTGFSTLQNLRGMPLAELKVDQSFVAGMTGNRHDRVIVAATIELAHSLGLRAVAEGVADESTRRILEESGCDLGQGWYLSRAVPKEEVPALLAEGIRNTQVEK